jgi:hypothetical protein
MKRMNNNKLAAERYHHAKLALFNIRLLNRLQNSGQPVAAIICDEAKKNGMNETPNLLHQATYLQFAYTCLVWLWESAKKENLEQDLLNNITAVAARYELQLPCENKIKGERKIKNWKAVIRLVRNALGHGSVETKESNFLFSDINNYKNSENASTVLTLSWGEVYLLSEVVIHSMTGVLFSAENMEVTPD